MRRELNALRQNEFDAVELNHPNLLDDLTAINCSLILLEKALPKSSPEEIKEKVERLDLKLLRYACLHLRIRLANAAMEDGAELLVRALVNGNDSGCGEQAWEDWLVDATCWPALLKHQWYEAREQAWRMLKDHLDEQGIVLDFPAEQELIKGVVRLTLEEALGEALMKRFYPPEKASGEGNKAKEGESEEGWADGDAERRGEW